jgi:hypothetical protein
MTALPTTAELVTRTRNAVPALLNTLWNSPNYTATEVRNVELILNSAVVQAVQDWVVVTFGVGTWHEAQTMGTVLLAAATVDVPAGKLVIDTYGKLVTLHPAGPGVPVL